jgi:ribosomal-protein-alanine N-acetyltransferase
MNGLVVRQARGADLAGVVRLERAVAEAPHWPDAEYEAIMDQLGGEGTVRRCFFVAELDGRVVGFAIGKAIGSGAEGLGELESVAVEGTARRMGAGRALCGAVIDWCRSLGLGELELEVRAASGGAVALYRGLGFAAAGRRSGYYQEPADDALLMHLDLARNE